MVAFITTLGIPNKAFATFANAVGGNAWEDPGHIWFSASKLAGSDQSFAQFAYQTLEAAKQMGKERSYSETAISLGWRWRET